MKKKPLEQPITKFTLAILVGQTQNTGGGRRGESHHQKVNKIFFFHTPAARGNAMHGSVFKSDRTKDLWLRKNGFFFLLTGIFFSFWMWQAEAELPCTVRLWEAEGATPSTQRGERSSKSNNQMQFLSPISFFKAHAKWQRWMEGELPRPWKAEIATPTAHREVFLFKKLQILVIKSSFFPISFFFKARAKWQPCLEVGSL